MKLIFSLFFTLAIANAYVMDKVDGFWERELQSSTQVPTGAPVPATSSPTKAPVPATPAPTPTSFFEVTPGPSQAPSGMPTSELTAIPSMVSSSSPSNGPTETASEVPSAVPSSKPTVTPIGTPAPTISSAPTFTCNLDPVDRRAQILTILEGVSLPALLNAVGTPQNTAAEWLIGADEFYVCPGDDKLIQRYVMALFYYSTDGDAWTSCSQGDAGCTGTDTAYLSPVNECEWFGSTCNIDLCMTEIVFEANDVAGTIPFELEQLGDLEVLSLEQGGLELSIPTNLGTLSNLRIIDLDFNAITGPIPEEVYGLSNLEQLDLNSNKLTGTLSVGIGNLVNLQLLQVYENLMTGTIPVETGNLNNLVIGEFYNNTYTGSMPQEVCDNRTPLGVLNGLTADCAGLPVPQIECSCCTGCAEF